MDFFRGLFHLKRKSVDLNMNDFDLNRIPSDETVDKIIEMFKKRYPKVYKVLVGERNEIMASRIAEILLNSNDRILVVVGAGHKRELWELIVKYVGEASGNA